MDESKQACEILADINLMIEGFTQDMGEPPQGLVMGMSVVLHVIEHLKEEGLYNSKEKALSYRGVPIRVVGWEDCCFMELELSQIMRFRELKKAYEANEPQSMREH